MPSRSATRAIEPRGLSVSARTSKTILTARSRSSAGCGFLDTMSPNLPRGHGLQGTRGGPHIGKELGVFKLDPEAEQAARRRLSLHKADAFLARLEQLSFDIFEPLERVYSDVIDVTGFIVSLVRDALNAAAARPTVRRLLDRRREINPAWFQGSRVIGYACYVDRFAGSLRDVRRHLDYLA